jgi:hypothetical protein
LGCLAQFVVSHVKNTYLICILGEGKCFDHYWSLPYAKIVNVVVVLLQKEYMLHFKEKLSTNSPTFHF